MSETELQNLLNLCQNKIGNNSVDLSLVSSDLYKAENLLRQIKIELTCLPAYEKQETMSRCLKYNNQISQIKKLIRDREQEKLFSEKIDSKLKSSSALLEKQGENLEMSKRVALESEAIASNTMVVLKNQRNQLQRSMNGAKEIQENLSKSNRTISSMQRRSVTNKLIMVVIIFLLAASILLISFLKITR